MLNNDSTDENGVRTGWFKHQRCRPIDFIYAPSHSAMIRSIEYGEKHENIEDITSMTSSNLDFYGRVANAKVVKDEGRDGVGHERDAKDVKKHEGKMLDALSQFHSEIMGSVRCWTDNPRVVNGISMERLFNGENPFRSKKRVRMKQEVVALFVPTNSLANIDPAINSIRASAALAAAEILEEQGYMVEIYALAYSTGVADNGNGAVAITRIKSADEVFNLYQAASAMSSWVWRNVTFSARSLAARRASNVSSSGAGTSQNPDKEFCEKLATILGCDAFSAVNHIPRNNNVGSQVEKAVDAVVTAIEEVIEQC